LRLGKNTGRINLRQKEILKSKMWTQERLEYGLKKDSQIRSPQLYAKIRLLRCAGNSARMGESWSIFKMLTEKPPRKRSLGRQT
jgi:hypothetical protein